MKEYIISIIGVTVIGSLVSLLVPDDPSGGHAKGINLIIGLCVILVSVNPVKNIVHYINELDGSLLLEDTESESEKYSDIFDGAYENAEVENLKNGIFNILSERFEIDRSECSVNVGLSDNRDLERVTITLYGTSIFKNTAEIEAYFGEILNCEIITIIG